MPAPATAPGDPPRAAVAFIFITVFIDLLGVGVLIPVIPTIVRQFAQGGFVVGLVTLAYSAAQFLATPALGAISDRVGRRPVLLLSLVGSAVGYALFGAATSLGMLIFARVLDGVTGGNISTAQAYLADVSSPAERGRNFALVGAAFGLGFVIGPAVGGALSQLGGPSAPAYAAGALSLAAALFGYLALPESLPPERRHPERLTLRNLDPFGSFFGALTRPALATLLWAWLAAQCAAAGLQSNFALFALDRFGLGPAGVAGVFTLVGVVGASMQGLVVRRALREGTEHRWATRCLAGSALGLCAIAIASSVPWLYVASALYSMTISFLMPSFTALVSQRTGSHEQGAMIGVLQAGAALMRVLGPAIAGLLYDHVGYSAPYWGGAVLMVVGIGVLGMGQRPSR